MDSRLQVQLLITLPTSITWTDCAAATRTFLVTLVTFLIVGVTILSKTCIETCNPLFFILLLLFPIRRPIKVIIPFILFTFLNEPIGIV